MKHILLSLALIATPLTISSSKVFKQDLLNNKQSINFNEIELEVQKFVNKISSQLIKDQFNSYKNEIDKILKKLKKGIIKIEDLQKDAILRSAYYSKHYFKNNSFNKIVNINLDHSKLFSITYEKAKEYQNQLRRSYAIAVSVSTTSAIAAAGFWAIAWQLWPKVFAVGCSVISAVSAIVATHYSNGIEKNKSFLKMLERPFDLLTKANTAYSVYSALEGLTSLVWKLKVNAKFFPGVSILISAIETTVAWIDYYRNLWLLHL